MPRPTGAPTSHHERDELLVAVGGEVGEADDRDEADKGGTGAKLKMPPPAAAIGMRHDQGNTDQHRHRAERTEVVDCVEGGVDLLGEHHGAGGQAQRAEQDDHE